MNKEDNNTMNELESVCNGLSIAEQHGLQVEVVLFALYHARRKPEASIEECMLVGLNEWVK